MHSFMIDSSDVIGAFNATSALQTWLRPGLLAYVVGEHVDALRTHAVRLFNEREAMLDEAALKYPAVWPREHDDAGKPHPQAGQRVTRREPNGTEITLYKSADAGAEFQRRVAELMGAKVTLTVNWRLTLDDVRKIDSERLPAPRSVNGQPPSEQAVDFSALMSLIERPQPDANGIKSSSSTSAHAPQP